ncbi:MAG TPA: glycosyltransferase [Chthoniobacteraceae bacterium]|nr:glycosyltransferase [Chthoniobacteraceae bacterium]
MAEGSPMVDFSIVTPSFKQVDWLELCAASIADQQGLTCEHIVQDGGSGEAIEAWKKRHPEVQVFEESDDGMYDAINRGLKRAQGRFCAYLNCDEQYLPGALAEVAAYFDAHPEVDVVFGDAIVVDDKGEYLCQRQTLVPNALHTATCHLSVLTCATFYRRSIVDRGLLFDPAWRDVGDSAWMVKLIRNKVRMAHLPRFTTTFAETGDNMGLKDNARREARLARELAGVFAGVMRPFFAWHHRFRRLLAGYYFPKKSSYSIYTHQSPRRRVNFDVERPTFIWPNRMRAFQ